MHRSFAKADLVEKKQAASKKRARGVVMLTISKTSTTELGCGWSKKLKFTLQKGVLYE